MATFDIVLSSEAVFSPTAIMLTSIGGNSFGSSDMFSAIIIPFPRSSATSNSFSLYMSLSATCAVILRLSMIGTPDAIRNPKILVILIRIISRNISFIPGMESIRLPHCFLPLFEFTQSLNPPKTVIMPRISSRDFSLTMSLIPIRILVGNGSAVVSPKSTISFGTTKITTTAPSNSIIENTIFG